MRALRLQASGARITKSTRLRMEIPGIGFHWRMVRCLRTRISSSYGRLPSNAHLTFPGCDGDALLFLLDVAGFAVSTGSACAAGVSEPSHVLAAMGVPEGVARGALRFTLGDETTAAEIDALVAVLPGIVAQARAAGLSSREPTLGR